MCLLASVGLQAQTIKGRVMEETEDGEVALPGANVYWVGTSKGSVSDANGEFKIKWEKVGKLVVSFIAVERDDERAAEIIDRIRQSGVPTLVVVNKIDLTTQEALEALVEKWRATLPDAEIIPISAREGFNIAGLFDRILALLPEGEPFYPKDTLTDKTLRFFASEIIREKILRNYDKEIPYSCEIEIEEYREEPGIDRISAVIYVARNSQKGILIGHKGEKLKKVGRQAREELEEFLRKKVFLQLFVKVSEDWRNDQRQLRRFGYDPQ